MLQRVHQEMAQAVAAFEVGIHKFEADFVDPGPAQQHLGTDVPHSDLNIEFGV